MLIGVTVQVVSKEKVKTFLSLQTPGAGQRWVIFFDLC
jgi:hypothetical protein